MPAPPVEVIRLGDAPAGFDRAVRPADLPPDVGTFALSVGTFEVRKNHGLLTTSGGGWSKNTATACRRWCWPGGWAGPRRTCCSRSRPTRGCATASSSCST